MSGLIDAWQAALAAEHAAVWGYGALGPHLAGADIPRARADERAHRALRDATTAAMSTAGIVPVAAHADYPFAAGSTTTARALALRLEESAASAWRFLIAQPATAGLRTAAQAALTSCAVRAVGWRRLVAPASPTVPFPGF